MKISHLEERLLLEGFRNYWQIGFPHPKDIKVTARDNTGAGRHTRIEHDATVECADGVLEMGQFDMAGLENGAIYRFLLEAGKIRELEVIVNGSGYWNGDESLEISLYDVDGKEVRNAV